MTWWWNGKIRRLLIGEGVELRTVLKKPLGRITADPGPESNRSFSIWWSTRATQCRAVATSDRNGNVTLNQKRPVKKPRAGRCDYVVLTITDSGVGRPTP